MNDRIHGCEDDDDCEDTKEKRRSETKHTVRNCLFNFSSFIVLLIRDGKNIFLCILEVK